MASGSGSAVGAGTVLQLDLSQKSAVNFTALKRIDKEVEEIITSSNFCAVYEYLEEAKQWVCHTTGAASPVTHRFAV